MPSASGHIHTEVIKLSIILVWYIIRVDDSLLTAREGSGSGASAIAVIIPEMGVGVTVLTSVASAQSPVVPMIARTLLDHPLGIDTQ